MPDSTYAILRPETGVILYGSIWKQIKDANSVRELKQSSPRSRMITRLGLAMQTGIQKMNHIAYSFFMTKGWALEDPFLNIISQSANCTCTYNGLFSLEAYEIGLLIQENTGNRELRLFLFNSLGEKSFGWYRAEGLLISIM